MEKKEQTRLHKGSKYFYDKDILVVDRIVCFYNLGIYLINTITSEHGQNRSGPVSGTGPVSGSRL
jgi:hypothetical protein